MSPEPTRPGGRAPADASPERLGRWIAEQRWFARGDGEPDVAASTRASLGRAPALAIVLVPTTNVAGDDEGGSAVAEGGAAAVRYQLVRAGDRPDVAGEPSAAGALGRFVASEGRAAADDGAEVRGRWIGASSLGRTAARPLGAEQSNTSIAIGGTHVLKVLRRVRPGPHPEVEIGRHLAGVDLPVAPLAGWYEHVDPDGTTTVLGIAHELVPGALDGWALALSALAADPAGLLARLHELGVAVARIHGALAAPGDDGTFGARPMDGTEVWALADLLLEDPSLPRDAHPAVARAVERVGADAGAAIRTHGDLHLGQTVVGPDGWVVLDFEGEPTRSLAERRALRSPLRDVAGMLRSFSYAAASHARAAGAPLREGWEPAARAAFLDGYLATLDPALLPASAAATRALLDLFELEKVVYELAYERTHRPDWLDIPLAGLASLIERTHERGRTGRTRGTPHA